MTKGHIFCNVVVVVALAWFKVDVMAVCDAFGTSRDQKKTKTKTFRRMREQNSNHRDVIA